MCATRSPQVLSLALAAAVLGCATEPGNLSPDVQLLLPLPGTSVRAGEIVELAAEASDVDGTVQKVRFLVDGLAIGEDYARPYETSWDTEGAPLHSVISAVAYDDAGATGTDAVGVEVRWAYAPPPDIGDGWETGSLEDANIDTEALERMVNALRDTVDHLVQGITLVRHGRLVFEVYFPGRGHPSQGEYPTAFGRETLHNLSSVTKSFTSTLLGIAIDRGLIDGVDQPVADFFPEYGWLGVGDKANLTLEHFITMSSGLRWDQMTYPILDARNDIAVFQRAPDPWEEYLSRPLLTTPGSYFLYSEGSINIVGEVIRRASGQRLDVFAAEYLFRPLDVEQQGWAVIRPELAFVWASGDLQLSPRSMAKLGQLYLNGGRWSGRSVVSQAWLDAASAQRFSTESTRRTSWDRFGYGYAWWLAAGAWGEGAVAASGWGHQWIVAMPEFDMVAAFTGGAYWETPPTTFHDLMIEHIRPAIR